MKPLVVGNWKGYITSYKEAAALLRGIERALPAKIPAGVAVCPPTLFLHELKRAYRGKRIAFGAQDAHYEGGAATGFTPMSALKGVGVRMVLVGHAERRALGETDALVARKVGAALDSGLTPIVCLGETSRDREGHYLEQLRETVRASLESVQLNDLKKVIIAYEPVWAIGAPLPPGAATVRESIIFIRKVLAERFGRDAALKVRILYGGAVDVSHAPELAKSGGTNGFLLGRASVDPESFGAIVSVFQ